MLLHILLYSGQPLTTKNDPAKISVCQAGETLGYTDGILVAWNDFTKSAAHKLCYTSMIWTFCLFVCSVCCCSQVYMAYFLNMKIMSIGELISAHIKHYQTFNGIKTNLDRIPARISFKPHKDQYELWALPNGQKKWEICSRWEEGPEFKPNPTDNNTYDFRENTFKLWFINPYFTYYLTSPLGLKVCLNMLNHISNKVFFPPKWKRFTRKYFNVFVYIGDRA